MKLPPPRRRVCLATPVPARACSPRAVSRAAAAALAACAGAAQAANLDTSDPDWTVRWDNTVKATALARLKDASPGLVDSFRQIPTGAPPPAPQSFSFPQALNFNAGDDNFRQPGLVSERLDLLSEFDAVFQKSYGVRVSAAAWYDAAYSGHTDATDPLNGQTPSNQFPATAKRLAGHHAEVLDAFVFGGWTLGASQRLNVKIGQHALLYGESLFFGDNAVAKAQGPVDVFKLLASPNAQFKEIVRPVPQVSAQLQLNAKVSVGAYYQFRWESDRLPPSGSYFSSVNIPWGSAQPEFVSIGSGPLAGDYLLAPGGDQKPRDSGQFGAQLKWRLDEADIGFYAARFHDKDGQLFGNLNIANPAASSWYYRFPGDISVVGASASQSVGDFNLSAEASVRNNMPLRSQNILYPGAFGPAPQVATGRTAHLNLSTLASFGPNFIARESGLVAELAWNRVLKTDDPDAELDAGRTRDATALQFVYTPSYRQALPGLDLAVPVGVRYTLSGNSSVTAWDAKGAGNASIGLEGNYLGGWLFAFGYTHYIGKPIPFVDYAGLAPGGSGSAIYSHGNVLADRDFLSMSIRRTF